MKDQVDALQTSGIAATFLNSTLDDRKRARVGAGCIAANSTALCRAGAVDAR